jgi:hypothetical protein
MKLYVQGKSKKEINSRLEKGEAVYGENYSLFGGAGSYKLDDTLADGTAISVFEKLVGGNPYAKAYGTWNIKKGRVV